jgi:hypothetical protein
MENQQLQIKDGFSAGGEYANAMQISHNKEEFIINFFSLIGLNGRVISKIITTPGHIKRMLAVMEENVKKYEETFGQIEKAEVPKDESIGFQVK